MKIAILTPGILPIPAVQGGAVENLIDFYLDFNERHHLHDITIFSIWNKDVKNHPALSASSNHYYYINTTSTIARIKRRIYKLKYNNEYYNYFIEYFFEESFKEIKKKNFDYIVLENRPGYALKLANRGYSNIVLHLHNDLLNSNTPNNQYIYNKINLILTVSDYINNRVSSIRSFNHSDKKVLTIHNGIDLNLFSKMRSFDITRKDLKLKEDDFVIVYSGRINSDKGISELIDAMILLKNYTAIKLLVIGSSFFGNISEEDEFTLKIKDKAQSIKEKIIFTGYIPYNKVPNYLQLSDIAIIPSIWNDPFPTSVLEAQAMGLPIITTPQGGINEEVSEKNAIIIPINNDFVNNLSKEILNLFSNPEKRDKMSKASVEHSKIFNKDYFSHNLLNAISTF